MNKKITMALIMGLLLMPNVDANANTHAKSLQNLGFNEIMFAQGMIPHHKQAITISQMALKKSKNTEILKLSRAIINAQNSEVTKLTYWLKATKSSMTMDHEMHMSGMLSEKEMADLNKLTGNQFDKKFLELMIKHHQGALEMLDLLSGTKNKEAKALANEIKVAQSAEITSMKKMLNKSAK